MMPHEWGPTGVAGPPVGTCAARRSQAALTLSVSVVAVITARVFFAGFRDVVPSSDRRRGGVGRAGGGWSGHDACAGARSAGSDCPHCGSASVRVHSRYTRRLADAAVGGARVVIELLVRRFKCPKTACPAVRFAEQISGLTSPHARMPATRHTCVSN
ncbi:transposase family protein [Streptomyces sp. NPDC001851]|uniref:transposase family protein n=1 Tax=Streptomyces sp. NPDC001851 TaxID=3154529 RepID=UPI00331A427B